MRLTTFNAITHNAWNNNSKNNINPVLLDKCKVFTL